MVDALPVRDQRQLRLACVACRDLVDARCMREVTLRLDLCPHDEPIQAVADRWPALTKLSVTKATASQAAGNQAHGPNRQPVTEPQQSAAAISYPRRSLQAHRPTQSVSEPQDLRPGFNRRRQANEAINTRRWNCSGGHLARLNHLTALELSRCTHPSPVMLTACPQLRQLSLDMRHAVRSAPEQLWCAALTMLRDLADANISGVDSGSDVAHQLHRLWPCLTKLSVGFVFDLDATVPLPVCVSEVTALSRLQVLEVYHMNSELALPESIGKCALQGATNINIMICRLRV